MCRLNQTGSFLHVWIVLDIYWGIKSSLKWIFDEDNNRIIDIHEYYPKYEFTWKENSSILGGRFIFCHLSEWVPVLV